MTYSELQNWVENHKFLLKEDPEIQLQGVVNIRGEEHEVYFEVDRLDASLESNLVVKLVEI